MNNWAVRRGECYGLVGEWHYMHSNTINFCDMPLGFGINSLTKRECVARIRSSHTWYELLWCKTLHLHILDMQTTQDFINMPLWAKKMQCLKITESVERLSRHAFMPPPGPISSVLSPHLCRYLRPTPICCMIVCFLFNGEHKQSDVIRAALMTGWLPNPARFHALLMLTCWIQHWNGEIREKRERERLKDLAFEAIKLPCSCKNNVKMQ